MPKENSDRKKGILLWFQRIWNPHGHKRKKSTYTGATGLVRHAGDRFIDDECCRFGGCCICILIILLIMFGGFFGGFMAGYDTDIPTAPDIDTAAYYQLKVSISAGEEDYYLADNMLYIGDVEFTIVVYAVAGGIPDYDIETFTATETIIGESTFDYRISTLLYVEIFNDEYEFFGSDYITSGTMDTVLIMHLGAVVYTANISWLMNGAGNRW
jgi:hypothetical protein